MIRRARVAHADAPAALQVRAWRAAYAAYVAEEHLADERGGRRVDERPHDPDRWGWARSLRYRKALTPAAAPPRP